MRRLAMVLMAGAAVWLAGCVVTSVYPFYTQKDLVFEPALVGDWVNDHNPQELWKFQKSAALGYRLTLIETTRPNLLEARSFKLQGQLFLDLLSTDQDYHVIPPHYLLKVTQLTPNLRMAQLNQDWLKSLLTKEPSAIRHELVKSGDKSEDQRIVLTGDTAELQKFITKHLDTKDAWKEDFELKRESPLANP